MVTRDAGGEAEADKAGVGKLASKRCGQIPVPRLRRGDGQHLGPQNKLCERYKGLVPLSPFSLSHSRSSRRQRMLQRTACTADQDFINCDLRPTR